MPTLEEIAKLSGASRSTVSRVVNNDPNVSEKTRRKVLEVIQRVNYHPNVMARSLAGGRTRILGLAIPTGVSRLFTDPFFPLLIQGVSSACNQQDYSVMLWVAEADYERRSVNKVTQNQLIDGLIVASMLLEDPLVESLIENDIPTVLIGRHPNNTSISYVDVDNHNSAREIVSYLLRLGYRRIATVTGPQNMIAGADRYEGYKVALRQWGITLEPGLVADGDFSEEAAYSAMRRILPHKPDAVFAASNSMAIGVLRALNEAGLRVPEDVAVVGFDDMPFAAHTTPPLTTVRQPVLRAGSMAADTLMSIIDNPGSAPRRIILPTELVIREILRRFQDQLTQGDAAFDHQPLSSKKQPAP